MKLMQYIIFDLEWNQCPVGKEKENTRLPFEIIEIGAVKTDENLQIIDRFSSTVSPRIYRQLHYKVREMSSLTAKDLQDSPGFKTVVTQFLNWCGTNYRFCTWGSLDIMELQRNMQFFKIKHRFEMPLIYYDIQKLFNLSIGGDKQLLSSLSHAIEYLDLPTCGEFHRALSDAEYTLEVMRHMDFAKWSSYYSIDCYYAPSNRQDEIFVHFPTYSKFISRKFSTKERALLDEELKLMRCHTCGQPMQIKIPWFSDNAKLYYGAACCKSHGLHRCKIKMKKTFNNKIYATKITVPTDESGVQDILTRQTMLRERRKEKRHNNKNEVL